jgi:B9 domain-containing protein 1
MAGASGGTFRVIVHGTVESAECLEAPMLYCRTTLALGREWSLVLQGTERANTVDVVTQMAECQAGPVPRFAWNSPFEFVLESGSPRGWPQVALGLTRIDASGVDHVVAYARCHVPMRPGVYRMDLPLLSPVYATPQHKLFGAFSGRPELRDFAFLCSLSQDRAVLSARPVHGYVRVAFDVTITGMAALGYSW